MDDHIELVFEFDEDSLSQARQDDDSPAGGRADGRLYRAQYSGLDNCMPVSDSPTILALSDLMWFDRSGSSGII